MRGLKNVATFFIFFKISIVFQLGNKLPPTPPPHYKNNSKSIITVECTLMFWFSSFSKNNDALNTDLKKSGHADGGPVSHDHLCANKLLRAK